MPPVHLTRPLCNLHVDVLLAYEARQAMLDAEMLAALRALAAEGRLDVSLEKDGETVAVPTEVLLEGEDRDAEIAEAIRDFVLEAGFCRIIDSFLAYLREIVFLMARQRPQILASSEKVIVADVLRCGSFDHLLEMIAESKVDTLSRSGWRGLVSFVEDRIGIAAFADEGEKRRLGWFVDLRNLHVHHRGQVHERIKAEWKLDLPAGTRVPVGSDLVKDAVAVVLAVARRIDAIAIEGFGVPVFDGDAINQEVIG